MNTEKMTPIFNAEHNDVSDLIDDASMLDLDPTGEDWEYDSCSMDSMTLGMCTGIPRAFVPCDF